MRRVIMKVPVLPTSQDRKAKVTVSMRMRMRMRTKTRTMISRTTKIAHAKRSQ